MDLNPYEPPQALSGSIRKRSLGSIVLVGFAGAMVLMSLIVDAFQLAIYLSAGTVRGDDFTAPVRLAMTVAICISTTIVSAIILAWSIRRCVGPVS
jgi:hypothetical protein